jgi:hypothetical protein
MSSQQQATAGIQKSPQYLKIFEEEPDTWGLRGDPFLWREMAQTLAENLPFPRTGDDFRAWIGMAFRKLVGKALSGDEAIYVERYAQGGMSSGYISPQFWRETAIPLLLSRYAELPLQTKADWDGLARPETLGAAAVRLRQRLAAAAKDYDWNRVLAVLSEHPELINTTRPGGSSLYAPLHQAAHGGAPAETVHKLIGLGAWRTLQNGRGERPVDIAERRDHPHLLGILAPDLKRRVPIGILLKMQAHFHAVIRGRAERQVEEHQLRLPELEPLLEFDDLGVWFAVPGMAGGFSYRLETEGVEAKLVSESWCRVVSGSGERHEITSAGSRLVDTGFV